VHLELLVIWLHYPKVWQGVRMTRQHGTDHRGLWIYVRSMHFIYFVELGSLSLIILFLKVHPVSSAGRCQGHGGKVTQ
jgi:hypothetical protein